MTRYFYVLHEGTLSKTELNHNGLFDAPISLPAGEHWIHISENPDLTIGQFMLEMEPTLKEMGKSVPIIPFKVASSP